MLVNYNILNKFVYWESIGYIVENNLSKFFEHL